MDTALLGIRTVAHVALHKQSVDKEESAASSTVVRNTCGAWEQWAAMHLAWINEALDGRDTLGTAAVLAWHEQHQRRRFSKKRPKVRRRRKGLVFFWSW